MHEALAAGAAEPQPHGAAGLDGYLAGARPVGALRRPRPRAGITPSCPPGEAQPAEGLKVIETLNGNTENVSSELPGAGSGPPVRSAIG